MFPPTKLHYGASLINSIHLDLYVIKHMESWIETRVLKAYGPFCSIIITSHDQTNAWVGSFQNRLIFQPGYVL